MKFIYYLISSLVLMACTKSANEKNTPIKSIENITKSDSNAFKDTTLVNNKKAFDIKFDSINAEFMLLTVSHDNKTTLIDSIDKDSFGFVDYLDFNKDGNYDILIDYAGNNSTYFLYLFDPLNDKFRNIDGYFNFPESMPIESAPNYNYSYHRAGCADWNWVSELYKIENFRIIHLGHIYGQGCDSNLEEEPQVIEIYRVANNNEEEKQLVEKLNYLENIPDFAEKWDFIEKYWHKNYQKF